MDELMDKVMWLEKQGMKPSLCLLGKKQMQEVNDLPKAAYTNGTKVEPDTINVCGHTMKVLWNTNEDFCEVYAKEKV